MTGDDEQEAAERARALRRRIAEEAAGTGTEPPSSPHEFVQDQMRERGESEPSEDDTQPREGKP